MNTKHQYYVVILIVLAAGIVMILGNSLDAAITLQPGADPITTSRQACDPSMRPYSTMNENTINRYLCCEAACRSFCGYEGMCISACIPACTP